MACDCIKNANKLLREKLNESASADSVIMMDGTLRMSLKGMYHKKNKNGEYQQKWTYVNILERLEKVDSIHRQDSIKQQKNHKAMKQRIQLTSKNINDLFKLPCVVWIQKRIVMGEHDDYIPSQNLDDCIIVIVHKPQECLVGTRAEMGDWLVEDDNGYWHVEKGGEK